jgi:prepilin-type N-terminal cleavage/methylation domain-containing protein
MQRHAGFSLVELMLATFLVGLIALYVGQALGANERAYQAVDQTAESQQHLRALLELVERDIRHAALLMPESASACGVDSTTGPDTLYLADGSAIDPQDDTAEYGGLNITAGGVANGVATLTLSSLIVEPSPPARGAYDLDNDGTNDSDFRVNGGIIIYEPGSPERGTTCGRITAVNVASNQVTAVLKGGITNGTGPYAAVPANEYRIVGNDIQWNGIVLAGNVEDFQVAWIFDTDGDNVVDADETFGAGGGTAYASTGATPGTTHEDHADLRELRVSIVARTRLEDDEFTRGMPQAFENRDGSAFVNDGFRRRALVTRVRLRNVGTRFAA